MTARIAVDDFVPLVIRYRRRSLKQVWPPAAVFGVRLSGLLAGFFTISEYEHRTLNIEGTGKDPRHFDVRC
jgi:hypothetical protein